MRRPTGRHHWHCLFSVPAPSYRLAAVGGVFSFLHPSIFRMTLPQSPLWRVESDGAGPFARAFPAADFSAVPLRVELALPGPGLRWEWADEAGHQTGEEATAVSLAVSFQAPAAATNGNPRQTRQPDDLYVRNADLIASYYATAEQPVGLQICWRIIDPGDIELPSSQASGIEAIFSTHTSHWDSDPSLLLATAIPCHIASALEGRRLDRSDPAAPVLCHAATKTHSYLEFLGPTDTDAFDPRWRTTAEGGRYEGRRTLFAAPLEKGVIRRARGQMWLLPEGRDAELASRAYEAFLHSPLPLTA